MELSVAFLRPGILRHILACILLCSPAVAGQDPVQIAVHLIDLQESPIIPGHQNLPCPGLSQHIMQPFVSHTKQRLSIAVIGAFRPQTGNTLTRGNTPLASLHQQCQQLPQFFSRNTERPALHCNRKGRNGSRRYVYS